MCPSRTRDKGALTSRPDQSPWAGLPYCGDRCICMLAWHHSILSTHFPALTTDSLAVWLNYAFPCSAAYSQRILRYLTRVLIFLVIQKFQHVNKSSKSVNTESMSRPFDMFWNPDNFWTVNAEYKYILFSLPRTRLWTMESLLPYGPSGQPASQALLVLPLWYQDHFKCSQLQFPSPRSGYHVFFSGGNEINTYTFLSQYLTLTDVQ